MQQFQPGEQVYVRLVFQNTVPIKNAYTIFVHQADENEHVVFGFKAGDEEEAIAPAPGRQIDIAVLIGKDQKPGVYVLDKINFETFSGNTLDYRGVLRTPPTFEVIPEREDPPLVEEISMFNKLQWEAMRHGEQQG